MNTPAAIVEGSTVRVDLAAVKAFDSMPPYVALVRQIVRKGEGTVYVATLPPVPAVGAPAVAYVRAWLGDVRVPVSALSLA
jgi:hypothetical protein